MDKKRRCVGCNEEKLAEGMIKITKDYKTGKIFVNPNNFVIGRSVYICNDENCLNTALKKNKIEKFLKKKMTDEERENVKILLNDIIVVKH